MSEDVDAIRAHMRWRLAGAVALAMFGLSACAPKVQVEAPKEPIVINLNVKIEHEIKVKVDKELDDVIADQEDIF